MIKWVALIAALLLGLSSLGPVIAQGSPTPDPQTTRLLTPGPGVTATPIAPKRVVFLPLVLK